jgi:hypothetical protein
MGQQNFEMLSIRPEPFSFREFSKGGKFSGCERTYFVGLYETHMAHCHLFVVVQTTRVSNGASAESCIKFENFLLVRVDLLWTEDVCIGSESFCRDSFCCVEVWISCVTRNWLKWDTNIANISDYKNETPSHSRCCNFAGLNTPVDHLRWVGVHEIKIWLRLIC